MRHPKQHAGWRAYDERSAKHHKYITANIERMPGEAIGTVGDERLLRVQYDHSHVVCIEMVGRPYAEEKTCGEEHRSRGNGKSGVEAAYPEKIVEYYADEGERKGDYEHADVVEDAFD
jgi:hypothetical protein